MSALPDPEGPSSGHTPPDYPKGVLLLLPALAARPEFRGAGLGGRLLDTAIAPMRGAGAHTLTIRATETSRDFYVKRLGAAVRSIEEETTRDGDVYYRLEVDLR